MFILHPSSFILPAKALTVYPVWAWAIVHGHKPVENRTWRTHYRGPLAIHASNRSPAADKADAEARAALAALGVTVPDEVPHGAIVGVVELVEVIRYIPGDGACVRFLREGLANLLFPPEVDPAEATRHPLASGPYCWVFAAARALADPLPCRGRQGLWNCDTMIPAGTTGYSATERVAARPDGRKE